MEQINILLVFLEGIISFFSPCVLPILPVYISILSNSSATESNVTTEGNFVKSTLLKNTIMFVLGISLTFFILGSTISLFNNFFTEYKQLIMIIGGMLIIILGAFYMGVINISFMQKEKKMHVDVKEMKLITAFILGFTFSFGWTPCLGPMIASVLIMASGAESQLAGNLLIGIYTIGFTLPFVFISLFYNKLINVVDKAKKYMSAIQKIGGLILIVSGLMMMIGGFPSNDSRDNNVVKKEEVQEIEKEKQKITAPDFTLVDQYGETHTLSEYEGKVVFLNFWATWCPPCKGEMPHIEEIYNQYNNNVEDVIILGVAAPNVGKEKSKEGIIEFLEENEYTFPVVFDNEVEVMQEYYIEAFPSTFIIDRRGKSKIGGIIMRGSYDFDCNLAQTLNIVGDKWTLLVLHAIANDASTNKELQEMLSPIPTNILSDRLKLLENNGLISTELYNEHPPRYKYVLAAKGEDLKQVFNAMILWGNKHLDGCNKTVCHESCKSEVEIKYYCSKCGKYVDDLMINEIDKK